ncbi:MAG: ATP-binding protein [Bacteroidetes bacterium]|nr:ATP-binding protein [Bacteroidota bacterium]
MANNVKITSRGIQRILKNYNEKLAVAEYIWNGFDAKANTIYINYSANELGHLETLSIKDNGYGIDLSKLSSKFNPFYDSEKAVEISSPKHTSIMHGKNGVGRLTFFTFAQNAKWTTTYKEKDELVSGSIQINIDGLNTFQPTIFENPIQTQTGTEVSFFNITISKEDLENSIIPFLICEFCWFLELNKAKNYSIIINGEPLDFTQNILDFQDDIEIVYEPSNTAFKVKYIQWQASLHKEFSKYYFLNGNEIEVYKDYTTLNKKGDEFFHSVFIRSDFFNDFDFNSNEDEIQSKLFGKVKSSPEYKFLIKEVNKILREKRKPFLRIYASRLVEKYEQDGIMPIYENEWEEKYKKPQLEETIIGLYEAQPKLFAALNIDQKKTFVRLLDLLLDSNERENIFKIINEVVELEPEEREDLANLFKTTKLNRIIETIKLIEDRYKTFYLLKDLVFNPDLKANEVDHLQKLIESHYWLFGEQYHLVTAAEPKFEEALRRYIFHLTEKDTSTEIDHPHKLKEMDIFACRQNILVNRIENIVVELKHPLISLGQEQYTQVHKYLQVITSQPEFNASNMSWEFYLVGKKFDTSGYIEDLIETNKNHGIPHLILSKDNGRVRVYAKKWSEIFADFEIKHKFLNDKLKLEREQLSNELKTAKEVVEAAQENTAIQPAEVKIPDGSK